MSSTSRDIAKTLEPSSKANVALRPRRILVAEDNPAIRDFYTDVLRQYGYEVEAAENGALAWQALRNNHFDLLVTDNDMPEMTGMELIRKIRSENRMLPTILASGSLSHEILGGDDALRFAHFLPKPFGLKELVRLVERLLQGVSLLEVQKYPA